MSAPLLSPCARPLSRRCIDGESGKIHVLADNYQKINILRVLPIGANRSQETDALDSGKLSCGSNELGSQSERSARRWLCP